MINRLLISVTVMLTLAVTIVSHSQSSKKDTFHIRSGNELCAELRHSVNESVRYELLTQSEADTIVERCFTLYGANQ